VIIKINQLNLKNSHKLHTTHIESVIQIVFLLSSVHSMKLTKAVNLSTDWNQN